MSVSEKNMDNTPVRVPFYKRWTAVKPMPNAADKKFYQITAIVGGGVALLSMILLLIFFRGMDAAYTWSALALGLGSAVFYALAYFRYELPNLEIMQRAADAAIYLTVFSAYTPLQLLLIRLDLYENGSIVCGWVSFGLVALFSAVFFIASLAAKKKFRMLGSFFYILMAFSLLFGVYALCNAMFFAPWLAIILMIVAILSFAATPVLFWFFDGFDWQMKVIYILTAVGTFACSLMTVLYAICGI